MISCLLQGRGGGAGCHIKMGPPVWLQLVSVVHQHHAPVQNPSMGPQWPHETSAGRSPLTCRPQPPRQHLITTDESPCQRPDMTFSACAAVTVSPGGSPDAWANSRLYLSVRNLGNLGDDGGVASRSRIKRSKLDDSCSSAHCARNTEKRLFFTTSARTGQHGSPVELELPFRPGIGAPLSPEPMPGPRSGSNLHPEESRRGA